MCFMLYHFFLIGTIYSACAPTAIQEYDHDKKEVIYKYPDGSIYDSFDPRTVLVLSLYLGICLSVIIAITYNDRQKDYNRMVKSARKDNRQEEQNQKVSLFKSTFDDLVKKYGEPDSTLCINEGYDIQSYIMPFSQCRKILLLGSEVDFSDIIDVQLTDDMQITKG